MKLTAMQLKSDWRRWVSVCVLALSVSACTTVAQPPVSTFHGRALSEESAAFPTEFVVAGRIRVKWQQKGYYGHFDWHHQRDDDQLDLTSPLGQTVARVERDTHGVRMWAQGELHTASTAEALTNELLGWPLPLDNLRYWIHGLVAPDLEAERTSDGWLQQGWRLRFSDFRPTGLGERPHLLTLERSDLEIRLVIHYWEQSR